MTSILNCMDLCHCSKSFGPNDHRLVQTISSKRYVVWSDGPTDTKFGPILINDGSIEPFQEASAIDDLYSGCH